MEKKFFRYNYRTYVAQFSENGNGNLWCYVEDRFKEHVKERGLIYLGRFEEGNITISENVNKHDYGISISVRKLCNCMYDYFEKIKKQLAKSSVLKYDTNMYSKPERNKLIVELYDVKGWTFARIAKELGLKSKSSVHEVYYREKEKLSTGKSKIPLANKFGSDTIKSRK